MSHRQVVTLIEVAAGATGRSPHTVGRLASGSGDFYARLTRGHDLTTRRADRVIRYLSDQWPSGAEWPPDIPRPEPGAPAAPARSDA